MAFARRRNRPNQSPFERKRSRYFPTQAKCEICRKKIDRGSLCYYCRKRRIS